VSATCRKRELRAPAPGLEPRADYWQEGVTDGLASSVVVAVLWLEEPEALVLHGLLQ